MGPATDTVTASSNADQAISSSVNITVIAPSSKPSLPLPAFPGAQGGGAAAVGGRGGQIMEVTNLNDSGSGSLRGCVEALGPRTCVFRVAGYITLQSNLNVRNPYLTIAGQTAPGDGITVRLANSMQGDGASAFNLQTNDVVFRYFRVRPGAGGITIAIRGRSAIGSGGPAANIVLDHISTSWSAYGNLGCWAFAGNVPQHNWSVQYSISAEGLSIPPLWHSKGWNCGTGQPGYGEQMTDIDIHHTLFESNVSRNPLMQIGRTREVNNIVFNTNYGATQFEGGVYADVIGDVFKQGPEDTVPHHEMQTTAYYSPGQPNRPASFYLKGNLGWSQSDPDGDDWIMLAADCDTHYDCEMGQAAQSLKRTMPLPTEQFPIFADPANTLAANLLPVIGASQRLDCMGNWVPMRDAVDQRLVDEFNGKVTAAGSPSDESQVGGYPTLATGTPCDESLHDGIPDRWKIAHGLSPSDTTLANNVAPNGYTYLENYLNGTDANLPVQ
jgi:pectate lyase